MSTLISVLASFFSYPWLPILWGGSIIKNTKYQSGIPLISNYSKMNTLFVIWGIILILLIIPDIDMSGKDFPSHILFVLISGVIFTYFYIQSAIKKISCKNQRDTKPVMSSELSKSQNNFVSPLSNSIVPQKNNDKQISSEVSRSEEHTSELQSRPH